MINFICPHCQQSYSAPEIFAGDSMTCQVCKQTMLVPLASQYEFDATVSVITLSAPKAVSKKKISVPAGRKHKGISPKKSGGGSGMVIAGICVVVLVVVGIFLFKTAKDKSQEDAELKEKARIASDEESVKTAREREAVSRAAKKAREDAAAAEVAKKNKPEPETPDVSIDDFVVKATKHQESILSSLKEPPPCNFKPEHKFILTQPSVFPLLTTPSFQILAGGLEYGKGRIAVFSDADIPTTGVSDPDPLTENVILWLSNQKPGAVVAVYNNIPLRRALDAKMSEKFKIEDAPSFLSAAAKFDVLVMSGKAAAVTDVDLKKGIPELLDAGRGILFTADVFQSAAAKKMLQTWGFVSIPIKPEHTITVFSTRIPMILNAAVALDQFKKMQRGVYAPTPEEQRLLASSMIGTLQEIPPADQVILPLYKKVTDKLTVNFKTAKLPLGLAEKIKVACLDAEIRVRPLKEQGAHPASDIYPGKVGKKAQREDAEVRLNIGRSYLNSLGYYAAPGEVVEIEIPESALKLGLKAVVGINMNILPAHDDWYRAPDICRYYDLKESVTRVVNPYGGPIYIAVPDKDGKTYPPPSAMANLPSDLPKPNYMTLTVRNAVKMARYVVGENRPSDWEELDPLFINNMLPPLIEIECPAVVLTLPAKEALQDVDRPEITSGIWEDVLDECKIFTGRDFIAPFPIRITTDAIHGANYSSYPIDLPKEATKRLVDRFESKRHPSNEVISAMIYFFLGKSEDLPGKAAAMRLLFTSYLIECTSTSNRYDVNPEIAQEKLPGIYTKILNAPYRWNTASTAEKILPYLQVVDNFGWIPVTDVVGEYAKLNPREWPADDEALNFDFAERLSRRVSKNLIPFFKVWGWRMPYKSDPADFRPMQVWMPTSFPDSYLIIK